MVPSKHHTRNACTEKATSLASLSTTWSLVESARVPPYGSHTDWVPSELPWQNTQTNGKPCRRYVAFSHASPRGKSIASQPEPYSFSLYPKITHSHRTRSRRRRRRSPLFERHSHRPCSSVVRSSEVSRYGWMIGFVLSARFFPAIIIIIIWACAFVLSVSTDQPTRPYVAAELSWSAWTEKMFCRWNCLWLGASELEWKLAKGMREWTNKKMQLNLICAGFWMQEIFLWYKSN